MKVVGNFSTVAQIRAIAPPAKGRERYKDQRCTGLYLDVSGTGKRVWRCQLKVEGKPKEFTLKPFHPDARDDDPNTLTLKQVRELVDLGRERASAGLPPFPDTSDLLFPAVWERFKESHMAGLASGTRLNYQTLRNHIGDEWDRREVDTLTDEDADSILRRIKKSAQSRGGTGAAVENNSYSYLKVFFRWCWERRLIDDMPLARRRMPNKQSKRDRVLSPAELVAIWNACELENYPYKQLIRFNLLVPVRIWSEAGQIERGSVDEDGVWRYKVQKTGAPQVLMLPTMALELLEECVDAGSLYFWRPTAKGAQGPLKRRLDKRCKVDDWTFHDFRTAFMTLLRELGAPFDLVDEIGRPPKNRSAGSVHYDMSERIEQKGEVLEYWCYIFQCFIEGKGMERGGSILRWRDWIRQQEIEATPENVIAIDGSRS